jgi:hypothetical protein
MVSPYPRDRWATGSWDLPEYRRRPRRRWNNVLQFRPRPVSAANEVAGGPEVSEPPAANMEASA